MSLKTPLAIVKEQFGEKAKLVDALEKLTNESLWVSRTNKDKGLAHVSNAKLLRLHATFTVVKEKFGTREKLIDAILELEKRSKDAGLRQKLSEWPVPRLYDAYKSASKRHGSPVTEGKKTSKGAAEEAKPAAKPAAKGAPKAAAKAAKPSAKASKGAPKAGAKGGTKAGAAKKSAKTPRS